MDKRPKFALIHGIINVILPVLVVIVHSGVLPPVENPWKYFWFFFVMAVFPIVSSLTGIVIAGVQLIRKKALTIKIGLLLSCAGLVMQIVFRFFLKI